MSRLLDALAHWPGRRDVQAVLAADGFRLPETYQSLVAFEYGNGDMDGLSRYWDEVAREHVCSAGRVQPDHRTFLGETCYRSAFLDALAADAENRAAAKAGLSLHPCYQLFMRRIRSPGDFGLRFTQRLEDAKPSEFEQFGIDGREWTGRKDDDLAMWLGRYARALGYQSKRSLWRRAISPSLVVYHGLDRGRRIHGNFSCRSSLTSCLLMMRVKYSMPLLRRISFLAMPTTNSIGAPRVPSSESWHTCTSSMRSVAC